MRNKHFRPSTVANDRNSIYFLFIVCWVIFVCACVCVAKRLPWPSYLLFSSDFYPYLPMFVHLERVCTVDWIDSMQAAVVIVTVTHRQGNKRSLLGCIICHAAPRIFDIIICCFLPLRTGDSDPWEDNSFTSQSSWDVFCFLPFSPSLVPRSFFFHHTITKKRRRKRSSLTVIETVRLWRINDVTLI